VDKAEIFSSLLAINATTLLALLFLFTLISFLKLEIQSNINVSFEDAKEDSNMIRNLTYSALETIHSAGISAAVGWLLI